MELSAKLKTGISLLDEQNQQLFNCLKTLETAVAEQRSLFAVYTLTRLTHQFRNHFNAEEKLMQAHGYPLLDEHIVEHREFRTQLQEFAKQSVSQDVSVHTLQFLRDWLTNHIVRHDMKCAPYFKNII